MTARRRRFIPEVLLRRHRCLPVGLAALAATLAMLAAPGALASEFSVTPTRIELKPGAMSETITVVNHAATPLRVSVRLAEWSQDAQGNDIYTDNADLVYFPRQMEIAPDSRRVVRVGARTPAGTTERAYRLFIEEQPEPAPAGAQTQISVAFRFGVPVFLPPALPNAVPIAGEPTLAQGKLSLAVKNEGNQHIRVNTMTVTDGAGYAQEAQGWYALAGARRTFSIEIPRPACQKAKVFNVTLEGAGVRVDKKLHVDPASCG